MGCTNDDIKIELTTEDAVVYEPQVFWINTERYDDEKHIKYFACGSETRSFKGIEVVEATSVVKAANAMQSALVDVTTVMHAHNLPPEVIQTVLDALELARTNDVIKYNGPSEVE